MSCLPFDVTGAILRSSQVKTVNLVSSDIIQYKIGTKKLEYKGHQWHEQCFLCDGCKTPIGSNPFVPRENENFCTKCYEDRFANKCTKCTGVRPYLVSFIFPIDCFQIDSDFSISCFSFPRSAQLVVSHCLGSNQI